MNTVVLKRGFNQIAANLSFGKQAIMISILALLATGGELREITITALSDAYFQVSVFVAGTLAVLIGIEHYKNANLGNFLVRHRGWQVPIAASLGALPGCGGAIIVTTQYVQGKISFGGVVAVLTATMGDAAFLLLAKEPKTALIILGVCLTTGIISGYVVNAIHGPDYMVVKTDFVSEELELEENSLLSPFYKVWMALFIPGAILGLSSAFLVDFGNSEHLIRIIGLFAALLAVGMWVLNPLSDIRLCTSAKRSISHRVIDTTNFVTFWVICAYLSYELLVYAGMDLRNISEGYAVLLPLLGLLVGFIPGCGPQIVITTMYLNGVLPISALLANAISNDGDALFPAIVMAPKAAIVATLYSAVPALIVGYGAFWLFD